MKAYSQDLRERVVRAVDQGYTRIDIINLFGVSRATIKRYLKQKRETGHLCRKPIPGRPPKKSAPLQAGLVAQLETHADATLEMHCDLWEQTSWREQCTRLDATKLVVIDECGTHIGLTPLFGRAPRGKRAYGKVPRNRGKNLTLIAALTWGGMGESMLIEGSANTVAFEQCIEKVLAPRLSAGQIVLMDNLAAHKSTRVEEVIQAKGCQLLFLPSYSPDFSPIEETFSKVKTLLRRAEARTRELLQEAIAQALQTVTAQNAQGWFRHCGYLPAAEKLAGRD